MLSDYAKPTVDVSFVEPFATRLLGLLEHFEGRVDIESGYRSYEEQAELYRKYLAGGNLAAKPGSSNHERGEAADLDRVDLGLTWAEVHDQAHLRGLHFPVTGEAWHCEADPTWIEPIAPEDDDMTLQELARAYGPKAVLGEDGIIRLPLVNDKLDGTDLYPLGDCISYTHEEMKRARLAG